MTTLEFGLLIECRARVLLLLRAIGRAMIPAKSEMQ